MLEHITNITKTPCTRDWHLEISAAACTSAAQGDCSSCICRRNIFSTSYII